MKKKRKVDYNKVRKKRFLFDDTLFFPIGAGA
jgi:hypothetical protein